MEFYLGGFPLWALHELSFLHQLRAPKLWVHAVQLRPSPPEHKAAHNPVWVIPLVPFEDGLKVPRKRFMTRVLDSGFDWNWHHRRLSSLEASATYFKAAEEGGIKVPRNPLAFVIHNVILILIRRIICVLVVDLWFLKRIRFGLQCLHFLLCIVFIGCWVLIKIKKNCFSWDSITMTT